MSTGDSLLVLIVKIVFLGWGYSSISSLSNQRVMRPGQLPPPSEVCQDTVDFLPFHHVSLPYYSPHQDKRIIQDKAHSIDQIHVYRLLPTLQIESYILLQKESLSLTGT